MHVVLWFQQPEPPRHALRARGLASRSRDFSERRALGRTSAAPLPSWNDGPAKQAILDFVRVTTDPASKDFVPPEERIATFDQDGTLWVEHPIYTQVIFCLDRVPAVVKAKPELAHVEPFKTVLTGDFEKIAKLSAARLREDRSRDPHRHGRGHVSGRREGVDRPRPGITAGSGSTPN